MAKYVNIPMNVFAIVNVTTMQYHMCYASIPMNEFCNINALMVQRRRCHTNISIDASIAMNVLTTQLGTRCSFDSPGLARNAPTPGKRSQGDSTL